METNRKNSIPNDATEPTGLAHVAEIREALNSLQDDLLQSGDVLAIREALGQAIGRAERGAAWREQLVGAGLDSPAGRRVLSACRHALRGLDCSDVASNILQTRNTESGARLLAQSLRRVESDAAAELDRTTPDVLDLYRLRTGAIFCVPRDPAGVPLYWDRERGRLVRDDRRSRDWCLLTIGEVEGASWKKARVGTANTIPEAEALCRSQRGAGDLFERSLAEAIEAE